MDASPTKQPTIPDGPPFMTTVAKGQRFAGIRDIANRVGPQVGQHTQHVVIRNDQPGKDGRRARRAYSEEYQRKMANDAARDITSGGSSATEFAAKHDLTLSTLCTWMKNFGKGKALAMSRMNAAKKTKAKKAPEAGTPVNGKSIQSMAESTQEREEFARTQFRLRPGLNIAGHNGLLQILHDRFGVGMDQGRLAKIRAEVFKSTPMPTPKSIPASTPSTTVAGRTDGATARIRDLMADGKVRTVKEVEQAIGMVGSTKVAILLAGMVDRKQAKRVAKATYQATGKNTSSNGHALPLTRLKYAQPPAPPVNGWSKAKTGGTPHDLGDLTKRLTDAMARANDSKRVIAKYEQELQSESKKYDTARQEAAELLSLMQSSLA